MSTLTVTTIESNTSSDLVLKTGNSSASYITISYANGNVGIGNTLPNTALVVNGTATVTAAYVSDNNFQVGSSLYVLGDGRVGIGNSGPTKTLFVQGDAGVSSNSFTLGTSNTSANGYTYLPNGLIMQWGTFICNSVSSVIFPVPFSTAVLSVSAIGRAALYRGANTINVGTVNLGNASIVSATTTTTNTAYYIAIGY